MLHFGYEGYQKLASSIMNGVKKAGEELKQNADVQVIGSPNVRMAKKIFNIIIFFFNTFKS